MSDLDTNIAFQPFPKSSRFIDRTGFRHDRVVVLGYLGIDRNQHRWLCKCDCGNLTVIATCKLGKTRSCGCRFTETMGNRRTHGKSGQSVYNRWVAMIQRCTNPKNLNFFNYGGRGIQVCERWRVFENFYADMGEPPTPKHTLERKNNNGNYEPDNVKWATYRENQNNRRSSLLFTYKGKTQSVIEWCRELHLPYGRVITRIEKGWDFVSAVTVPELSGHGVPLKS